MHAYLSEEEIGKNIEALNLRTLTHEVATITQKLNQEKNNPQIYYFMRSKVYLRLNDLQNSLRDCKQALRLKPDYPEALINQGYLLFSLGKKEDSIQAYEQAIRLFPDRQEGYYNKAFVLHVHGQFQSALECYRLAISKDQSNIRAIYNQGMVLEELGRPQQALESYIRCLNLQPLYYLAHTRIGVIQCFNREPEGLKSLARAAELSPNSALPRYWMAKCYEQLGYPSSKVQVLVNEALSKEPNHPAAIMLKATLFVKTQRKSQAIALLNQAKQKSSYPGPMYKLLGDLHTQDADYDRALLQYQQCLNLGYCEAEIREAIKSIQEVQAKGKVPTSRYNLPVDPAKAGGAEIQKSGQLYNSLDRLSASAQLPTHLNQVPRPTENINDLNRLRLISEEVQRQKSRVDSIPQVVAKSMSSAAFHELQMSNLSRVDSKVSRVEAQDEPFSSPQPFLAPLRAESTTAKYEQLQILISMFVAHLSNKGSGLILETTMSSKYRAYSGQFQSIFSELNYKRAELQKITDRFVQSQLNCGESQIRSAVQALPDLDHYCKHNPYMPATGQQKEKGQSDKIKVRKKQQTLSDLIIKRYCKQWKQSPKNINTLLFLNLLLDITRNYGQKEANGIGYFIKRLDRHPAMLQNHNGDHLIIVDGSGCLQYEPAQIGQFYWYTLRNSKGQIKLYDPRSNKYLQGQEGQLKLVSNINPKFKFSWRVEGHTLKTVQGQFLHLRERDRGFWRNVWCCIQAVQLEPALSSLTNTTNKVIYSQALF